jgi:hypothetical protein
MRDHRFTIVPGITVEGKYFATTPEHAEQWGVAFQKFSAMASPFSVVEVRIPSEFVDMFVYFDRLDGIGPAYYATIEELECLDGEMVEMSKVEEQL